MASPVRIPVEGEGDATEGDNENRKDDPKDVDDIAGQNWEDMRIRDCPGREGVGERCRRKLTY